MQIGYLMDKKRFYKDLGKFLGVPSNVEILNIYEGEYYREGCPTCGGDIEFDITVYGKNIDGTQYHQRFESRLADFLNSL